MRFAMFAMVLAPLLALAGCGGDRAASPIAVTTPVDAQLTCDQIDDEIASDDTNINARRMEIDQANADRTNNAVMGGLIGATTSEDGSAARVEINAYTQRTIVLRRLARQRKC
jgi:hypothetical protein